MIDNRNIDREEERQIDQKKADNRRDVEQRMKYQPMKTFEAKLSEKTAQELTNKESALREAHDQKTTKEEKQSILDKIITVAKGKDGEKENLKVQGEQREAEKQFVNEKEKQAGREEFETQKSKKEESADKVDQKEGEQSQEGYKRVAEKGEDQGGGSGSGGSDQGSNGDASGEQGFSFDQQSKNHDQTQMKDKLKKDFEAKISGVKKAGAQSRGFDSSARGFTQQNLDQIVKSVQIQLNEEGNLEFSVELGDEYFDGLKVSATRTDEGVVLKFICPNVKVRSTFIKYRPQVYANFKAKNISVTRIDVV